MDDLIKRARKELPALREAYELAISCRVLKELPQLLEELADALEAERKARADLERWADQARPVVEAVRDYQRIGLRAGRMTELAEQRLFLSDLPKEQP